MYVDAEKYYEQKNAENLATRNTILCIYIRVFIIEFKLLFMLRAFNYMIYVFSTLQTDEMRPRRSFGEQLQVYLHVRFHWKSMRETGKVEYIQRTDLRH